MGRSTFFRRELRALNERYLLAVPSNMLVRDLEAEPAPASGRGARPLNPFVRVDHWREALPADAWTRVEVRDADKGPLVMHVVQRRVLAITERTHPEAEETLVITRRVDEAGQTVCDYYFSSADSMTPAAEFARVANAEHRIEECIKRAKSQAGLSEYETRTWQGWHHHQTLSLLATWFLVQETRRGKKIDSSPHRSSGPRCACQTALRGDRTPRLRATRAQLSAPIEAKRTREILSPQKT